MYKWYQSNNIVYISFDIPTNVTKQDIQADISSSSIALGVKGYGLNCEGSLYLGIKSSKWAIKDGSVQVQMDKQSPGKWSQLLSEVTETNPKAIVLFEYEATADEELSLIPHEVINIISKDDSGWWEGSKVNLNGVFPSNFVSEFPTDYQPPEDVDLSNEVSKQEDTPISSVSRVGISMMGSMGSMDELKNKLINRKTATYNSQELEDAINSNKQQQQQNDEDQSSSNTNTGGGGFVAVQPTKAGAARPQNRVLLNRSSQQISNPVNPIQPVTNVQPSQQPAATVQLKSVKKDKEKEKEEKEKDTLTSSGSIPATTSKESQSTKDSKDSESSSSSSSSKGITSIFKKPLKKIQAISALTGSHGSGEEKSGTKCKAKVIYDFDTKEPNELALKKGDIVVVIAKDASGWWQGINQTTNAQGWFSNTFVEEIKEEPKPPKQVKSPPPKIQKPVEPTITAQPGTVEHKLQSLTETPKLETVKKPTAARNRKPPSRVRASYLLSDEEKEEREKYKQSFYSHIVSTNKDLEDEEDETPSRPLSNSGSYSPPSAPIERPSKPPPPKRSPISVSSGSVPPSLSSSTETASTAPSKPPPSKPAPRPPVPSQPPTQPLSTSDGYESNSPPISITSEDGNNDQPPALGPKPPIAQRSPPTTRKFPLPPSSSSSPSSTSPPSSLNSSSSDVAVEPSQTTITKPLVKPTPKPRQMPLPSSGEPTPSSPSEVDFKANLKPPPRSTSPPIKKDEEASAGATESQPTTVPSPFGLKKVAKPPPSKPAPVPPASTASSELAEKLNKFSDLAEPSEPSITPAGNKQPILKTPAATDGSGTTATKPAVRPPMKKAAAQQPPSVTTGEEQPQQTPPQLSPTNTPLNTKPKVAPRGPPSPNQISPNTLSPTPTSPTSPSSGPPPLASPSVVHKRNISNTNKPSQTNNNSKPLDFNQVCQDIANICSEIEEKINAQSQESPISTFKHIYPPMSESFFSVAVCSVDGQFWGNDTNDTGVNDQLIPMFQAIYPFLYSILCEEIGIDEISKSIDDQIKEESDIKPINDQKKPHNPFTLAGRLVSSHLFSSKYPNAITRIHQFLSIIQQLVNSNTVSCDMVSYLSQKQDSSDEMLVAHLLKSSGLINKPEEVLEFFYQLNSIQLNSKQISLLAATLAGEGVCPFSPQLKLAPKSIINKTNDTLRKCDTILSSQIDDTLYSKLIPVISDSGILMLVVPNLMGITLVTPCIFNNQNLSLNQYHIEFIKKLNNILK